MKEQTCCMDCVETPAGTVHGFGCLTVAKADRAAQEDAQRCPDGFRCGHCVANDKAKREAARAQVAQRIAFEGMHTNTAQLGSAVGYGYAQASRFTRDEVLTVLRSKKAEMHPESHSAELIDRLVRIFERME